MIRNRLDEVLDTYLPTDKHRHLTGGIIVSYIAVCFAINTLPILIGMFFLGWAVEYLQKRLGIGVFEWLDILYYMLGALVPLTLRMCLEGGLV